MPTSVRSTHQLLEPVHPPPSLLLATAGCKKHQHLGTLCSMPTPWAASLWVVKQCPCSGTLFMLRMPDPAWIQGGFGGSFVLGVVFLFLKTTLRYQQVTRVLDREEEFSRLCHHSFPPTHSLVCAPHSSSLIRGLIQVTGTLGHHNSYQDILFHTQTSSSQDESPDSVDLCLSHLQAMHFHLKRNLKTISQGTQQIVTIAMHQSQHGNYTPPGCL